MFEDGRYLDTALYANQGSSNSIHIRPAYIMDPYTDYYDYGEVLAQFSEDIAEVYGLDRSNTSYVMGYSNTAMPSLHMGADMAMSGADNVVIPCIEVASTGTPDITISDEERQALIDHNATILNIHASNSRSMTNPERYPNWQQQYNGVHLVDIKVNVTDGDGNDVSEGAHGTVYKYLVANGITKMPEDFDWSTLPDTWYDPVENRTYHFDLDATEWYVDENG